MRKILCYAICNVGLLLLCFSSFAQQQRITGTVRSTEGPLQGVTVTVKNTNRATLTDAAGSYTIMASKGEVLQFTSVGFTPQEVTIVAAIQLKEVFIHE